MNEKSHVSLEQHVCLVCGVTFDTGAILLDKHLCASMRRHTTTGWGLCAEHQKLSDDGFGALIECDPQRSGSPPGAGHIKPEHGQSSPYTKKAKIHSFQRWGTLGLDEASIHSTRNMFVAKIDFDLT